jgi:hypothetical protein
MVQYPAWNTSDGIKPVDRYNKCNGKQDRLTKSKLRLTTEEYENLQWDCLAILLTFILTHFTNTKHSNTEINNSKITLIRVLQGQYYSSNSSQCKVHISKYSKQTHTRSWPICRASMHPKKKNSKLQLKVHNWSLVYLTTQHYANKTRRMWFLYTSFSYTRQVQGVKIR